MKKIKRSQDDSQEYSSKKIKIDDSRIIKTILETILETIENNNSEEIIKKNTSKKGDDSVNYMIARINALGNWEATKMGEATFADFAVRRKGTADAWMPVQVKSDSTGRGQFNIKGKYENMVICLVELTNGVGGNIWISLRNDFPKVLVKNIYGKKNLDEHHKNYNAFRVLTQENLNARLHSFDTNSDIKKRSLDYLNVPSCGKKRKERLSFVLFERIAISFGHTIVAPEYENSATDWLLNGTISVQDKTVGIIEGSQFKVSLLKSNGWKNGKQQTQPYSVGDNNFYIMFVGEEHYTDKYMQNLSVEQFLELTNTSKLRGCYLFSEAELIATGHIATNDQKGIKMIRLPIPNPDGTFEPEHKGGGRPRIHNFQQNYFHNTNFQELFQKMLN